MQAEVFKKIEVNNEVFNQRSHTFFALLLDSLGLLAGLVALLQVQRAGPCIGFRVTFRPLTLHVSARRSAAGCCVNRCKTSIEIIGCTADQVVREISERTGRSLITP